MADDASARITYLLKKNKPPVRGLLQIDGIVATGRAAETNEADGHYLIQVVKQRIRHD